MRQDKIPAAGKVRLKEAIERLVQLYDAWGKPDEAAKWKQKLTEFEEALNARKPTSPAQP